MSRKVTRIELTSHVLPSMDYPQAVQEQLQAVIDRGGEILCVMPITFMAQGGDYTRIYIYCLEPESPRKQGK